MSWLVAITTIIYAIQLQHVNSMSMLVGHYHHNKRQQSGLSPQLTLDVEPHPGLAHSYVNHTPITEYYFPVDSGVLNFTCTIKHPSFKYKLTMMREQVFNSGDKGAPLDMIDSNDYVLNTAINDKRMEVEYSEPNYPDPSAKYLRVSLYIKSLKLADNGIYTCKYSTITKKIKVIVYKQPTQKDITLTTKSEKFYLNTPNTINCRVNDVYPKPKVTFYHSNRNDITESAQEKDLSNVKDNDHYLYSVGSTLNFVPKYTDNNQDLNCSVSTHTSTNTTLYKTLHLSVLGVQIVEEECNELQAVNIGAQEFRITCVYYSNPKQNPSWETKADEKSDGEQTTAEGGETQPSEGADEAKPLKLFENDEQGNYQALIEEYGAPNSGLYRAVLKLKEVRAQDLKNYTFKLDKFERVIRLDNQKLTKDLSSSDSSQSSSSSSRYTNLKQALVLFHSKVNLALIANLIAASSLLFILV